HQRDRALLRRSAQTNPAHGVLCQRRKRGSYHLLHLPEIQPGMEIPHPQPIYTSSLTSPRVPNALAAKGVQGRQYGPRAWEVLWQQNIASMVIRTATTSRARGREKSLARRRRRRTTALARGPSTYRVRTRFHAARSAARCCRECRRAVSVRSANFKQRAFVSRILLGNSLLHRLHAL